MRGGVASDDALSVKVHSTSALIPNAILVSPVIRIHLVDSETGAPLEPSGTSTTPVQTAPFDLSRRVKASLSPEWNEQLDIEETVKDVTHPRALLLFELDNLDEAIQEPVIGNSAAACKEQLDNLNGPIAASLDACEGRLKELEGHKRSLPEENSQLRRAPAPVVPAQDPVSRESAELPVPGGNTVSGIEMAEI